MSTAFANISFENKRFINGWTFTSCTFGITGDVSRKSWVGDAFTSKSPVTALKIRVFPTPAPTLFCLIARLSVAICFCPPLLRCCYWNEGPHRKGFLLLSSFRKTSLELFFDLTDSVKWSLNSFPKRFSSLVCSNSTLLTCFLPAEESTRSIECCTFDGTKSNYLLDQVKKWFVLEDLESRLVIMEQRQTSWHFPTLTILWIREPSRRELFSVFFPASHR